MKKSIIFLFLIFSTLITSIQAQNSDVFIDEKVAENTFSIVYVETETLSAQESRQKALTHAAEIAKKNGYSYFVLESEQNVQVIQTQPQDRPFHEDLYEELIIERDFGRDTLARQHQGITSLYPGLKVTITAYKERPNSKAYEVCTLTPCKNSP